MLKTLERLEARMRQIDMVNAMGPTRGGISRLWSCYRETESIREKPLGRQTVETRKNDSDGTTIN